METASLDFAFSTACFPSESREESLMTARVAGARRCEVALKADEADAAGYWARLLQRAELECWSVHTPFGGGLDLSSPDAEVRGRSLNVVLAALDVGVDLGARLAVVHGGAEPVPPEQRAAYLDASRDSLAQVGERCRDLGLRMAVEFLPRTCPGNSVAELDYLLDGTNHGLGGICLDLNHANLGSDLVANIAGLAGRILTVHASDNDGVDERHWLPGQGIIDWAEALAALRQAGYSGPFLYESGRDRQGGIVTPEALRRNYEGLIAPLLA